MSIENLYQLKEQLEKNQKYVAIEDFSYNSLVNASEARPLSQFTSQVNTEEFVRRCELLFEQSLRGLVSNGIPFDTIMLSSKIGFLCKEQFVKNIKSLFENHKVDDYTYMSVVKQLKEQASSTYVPLSFDLDLSGTGTQEMVVGDYNPRFGFDDKSATISRVSGIVNLNEFISRIRNLGYDIKILNYGDCQSAADYLKAVMENGDDTLICIVANLTKQNNLQDSSHRI